MRSLSLSVALACLVACNVPAEQFTHTDPPPAGLTYSANPAVYTKGVAIASNTPSSSGGPVASYSVAPALPAGLSLIPTTGVITGVPAAITPAATYTITATNNGGSTTASLSITVHDAPPSGLTYSTNPAIYTHGVAITPNTPSSTGGAIDSYAVAPALPPGLSLDASTGAITGTPTAMSATMGYTVTATNAYGNTTVVLAIAVNDLPPSSLTYSTNPAVYTKGTMITDNTPSSTGGAVASYSVSPALPAGLSLDTTTGVISGTPTVLKTIANYTVTATNGFGSTNVAVSITIIDTAPSGLTYATNPATYTKGSAIAANAPSSSGGSVVSYSVSPALPAGLSLNVNTGVLTGTPTAITATAGYTVTATNTGGSTTAVLIITVNDVPPSGLAYSTNPAVYTRGVAITANTPSSSGGAAVSYSVAPALPAGLSLNTNTGVITGTPTAITASAVYTVTATNTGGMTTANLTITVNDIAPSGLTYSTNPAIYTNGTAITPNTPSSGGGAVVSYSVSPALPAGLMLDTSTGVVSGTPTAIAANTTYTVTATNTGGSTTVGLHITVNDVAPSSLVYSTNPAAYTKGVAITANTPSSSGGPVVSYSVSPALPAGLTMSTSTGVVSGTPTAVTASAVYTVTATNTGGNTTAALIIAVNDVAPSSLTYSTNPATYTKGAAITANTPSSSGGPVVSYSVSPALPAGLTMSTSTGIVTGTPTALTASAAYTVTATNSGGSTTAALTIAVNDVAPSSLTYSTNPAVYTIGVAIASNTPSSSGGPVVSYAIAPALPAGLSMSTSTGVITGTPTAVAAVASYTVTATNTGGSTTANVSIRVNDVAPSGLTYSTNPAVYTKGSMITANTPSSGGGAVISYSISPALSAGLVFDTSTGVISGTPSALKTITSYTVTATNSGGSTTVSVSITVNDVAPSSLVYSTNPAAYTKNVAITANTPSSSGGPVVSYSVSPALPAGLTMSAATGIITGTPTAITASAVYTVTATNSGGSTTAALMIAVNDAAPTSLVYSTNPAAYTKNLAITANSPSSSGGAVVSYSVSPALPAGLSMSAATGVISGTPTAITASAVYTVTATNTGGSTSAALTIAVNDVAPSALAYSTNPAVYTKGVTIAANTPSSSGGSVVSYSVSPALPAGLSLSASTGVISGTPTAITATASYTVTATNTGGSTTANVSITVNDVAPSNLTYSANPATYNKSIAIAANTPSSSGGAVVSYSVSPALPAGLTMSTITGVITGTPTAITATATYTVTATNSGGSTTANVTITVNDAPPNNLTYSTNPAAYTKGLAITANTPSSGGGPVVSYSIAPALPTGLSFDNATGIISGTPLVKTATVGYTVTATNGGGSTSVVLSLGVNDGGTVGVTGVIAEGAVHTCAIVNGGVQCWGYNLNGQLGNNSTTNSSVPVQVVGLTSGVQAVTAGQYHSCALVNGGVKCWGNNSNGQLGNNSTTESHVPVQVVGLTSGVQAITAGDTHTCALINGGVRCWGLNNSGQLGNNSTTDSHVPVQGLTSGVQSIAAGLAHTCAVVGGAAQCWGSNTYGQLGNNSLTNSSLPVQVIGLGAGVQSIGASGDHSCAVVSGGAQCWGVNGHGELGNGSLLAYSQVAVQVTGLTTGVQSIATGLYHSCARVNGAAECWGANFFGQLGNNSTTDTNVPVQVAFLTSGVQFISSGDGDHPCALVNGGIRCWGYNAFGQLGNNSTTSSSVPVQVVGITTGLQMIANGGSAVCGLVNGGVQCWGDNSFGQLGNNTTTSSSTPVSSLGLTADVQTIAAGNAHACAVISGSAVCWGYNLYGQLGNNSTTDSHMPAQVFGLTSGVQAIAAGGYHTCAIVNGGAKCWGNNGNGQLGNNSTVNSSVPVQVAGLTSGVQAIAAGVYHTCAVVNGGIQCWGANVNGRLGNNSLVDSHVPVQVFGLTAGGQAIGAGGNHSCALVNGNIECWGLNSSGQLGNNSTTDSMVPVVVLGLSGVQAIATGYNHECALLNGGVQCWGFNSSGQLGNNSTMDSRVPVQVVGLTSGLQGIGAGYYSGCAIVNGVVECWGTTTTSPVPLQISTWQ